MQAEFVLLGNQRKLSQSRLLLLKLLRMAHLPAEVVLVDAVDVVVV